MSHPQPPAPAKEPWLSRPVRKRNPLRVPLPDTSELGRLPNSPLSIRINGGPNGPPRPPAQRRLSLWAWGRPVGRRGWARRKGRQKTDGPHSIGTVAQQPGGGRGGPEIPSEVRPDLSPSSHDHSVQADAAAGRAVLRRLEPFVLIAGMIAVLAIASLSGVSFGWIDDPGAVLRVAGVVLVAIPIWRFLLRRGVLHWPTIDTAPRKATDGRRVSLDLLFLFLGLVAGVLFAVMSATSVLPWWGRLLGVLVGAGLAAEAVTMSINVHRANTRSRRSA